MNNSFINEESILRVGEVCEVSGRIVSILVDKNKNLSDLFYEGKLLKNVSVGSFIEIKKGFLSLIGRIEAEKIVEDKISTGSGSEARRYRRYLTATLSGYINRHCRFIGGTRELPLIGNEAFIVTEETIQLIHKLATDKVLSLNFARTDLEDIEISLPVNGLMNSHIAIFGNTGSGKSNTLAALYQHGYRTLSQAIGNNFKSKCRFIIFDFNGEYISQDCITSEKTVYNLNTHHSHGDKIPMPEGVLLEHEILSVLTDATDKTQKPYLKRVLEFQKNVKESNDPLIFFRNILKKKIRETLFSNDRLRSETLFSLFSPIFNNDDDLISDLEYHSNAGKWKLKNGIIFNTEADTHAAYIYKLAENYIFKTDLIDNLLSFMYLQLIKEVISNKSNPEHVSHVINRMNTNRKDISKIFDTTGKLDFWKESNFVIINLNMVNINMKKMLPLLLAKWAYNSKKQENSKSTLHLIIDEAHNVLSTTSNRETESWKDYRLETFEEIIKEGRKFGVFVTISSQRPNDISSTIISQAHNYFIHRLINQNDLYAIEKSVSYIDKLTEDSIPTLSTGTCIFSGVVCPMPLKLRIDELNEEYKPKSHTISFDELIEK
ncbi:ATP-binding protein [Yersinia enterocolitica]|uniref:ATP-binding protein n=1 Tax=Yersinia kristensenii TaxID=28152 RepID=UPI0005E65088|nr:ATP-binding protein [Yersinia kristensenii]CNF36984.1 Type IV secretory pathway%2C VirB4 components [Yersinia kristensenii]